MDVYATLLVAAVLTACGGGGSTKSDAGDGEGSSTTGSTSASGSGESEGSASSGGSTGNDTILPDVLSLTGCGDLGLGPLCSVTGSGETFRANCSGIHYEGSVTEAGKVTMTSGPQTDVASGFEYELTCDGQFDRERGVLTADCVQQFPNGQLTCDLVSDPIILPGFACLELPPAIEDFVLCLEGESAGGTTLEGGSCRVIQDDCVFQAECADDITLVGTVSNTGMTFEQPLTALADAQAPQDGGAPAFGRGEVVPHACTASFIGTVVSGTCGAGAAGRNGVDTSLCSNRGTFTPVPTCASLSPSGAAETIFALDPCEALEEGEGIGQPVCVFRQNNCIWEIRCASDPDLVFTGRVQDDVASWTLPGGTCEASFDGDGSLTGACTLAGEASCELTGTEGVPGGDACPGLPVGTSFHTEGCGGASIACTAALQHQCGFMALCSFGPNAGLTIVGASSYVDDRPHLEFNGVGDWECHVDKATDEEIEGGDRAANEWYGNCTNAVSGGQCRDNYDPETGEGFRGLQLFFDE